MPRYYNLLVTVSFYDYENSILSLFILFVLRQGRRNWRDGGGGGVHGVPAAFVMLPPPMVLFLKKMVSH